MISKLKAAMKYAAALVLGGAAVTAALLAGVEHEGIPVPEARQTMAQLCDPQRGETFFLAIPQGTEIPKAWPEGEEGRVLGDCSGGTCNIGPDCEYHYHAGPLVAGYRVVRVRCPMYVAKGWKLWAEDTPGVRWLDSFGQVVTACRANLTGAQCLELLEADQRCWLLDAGDFCRYGRLYGPGKGGDDPCEYARVTAALPCTVDRGAGSEMTDATRVFAPEEFD